MRHSFPCTGPLTADIVVRAGALRVRARRTEEAVVEIAPHGDADASGVFVTYDGSTLAVRAPAAPQSWFRHAPRYDVEVTVPEHSRVRSRSGSAGTDIAGPLESLDVQTGSGDVTLEQADAAARLASGSGDIRAVRASGELTVRAGSGDVVLGELGGPARVKAGSGHVVVRVAHRDVEVTTGSGDVRVDAAREGELRLRTGSGDVVVGVPAGIPVWADVRTMGGVSNRLTSRGAPVDGQSHVRLTVVTASGSVELHDA